MGSPHLTELCVTGRKHAPVPRSAGSPRPCQTLPDPYRPCQTPADPCRPPDGPHRAPTERHKAGPSDQNG